MISVHEGAEGPGVHQDALPVARAVNPFGSNAPAIAGSAAEMAMVQREIAEVQASLTIAQRCPRNQGQAVERIINAFSRLPLAEKAKYAYAKGGSEITGPSIRAAEAFAQSWGNMSFGTRELDQRPGVSTAESFAWDMETNTRSILVFQVSHVVGLKGDGKKTLTDPRDVYELVANMGARRKRACILSVLPRDVVDTGMRQVDLTLKSNIKIGPELFANLTEQFQRHGVSKQALEKFIQRRLDTITPGHVIRLREIYNSLQDGMSFARDWFELEPIEPIETVVVKKGSTEDVLEQRAAAEKEASKAHPPAQAAALNFAIMKPPAIKKALLKVASDNFVSEAELGALIAEMTPEGAAWHEQAQEVFGRLLARGNEAREADVAQAEADRVAEARAGSVATAPGFDEDEAWLSPGPPDESLLNA